MRMRLAWWALLLAVVSPGSTHGNPADTRAAEIDLEDVIVGVSLDQELLTEALPALQGDGGKLWLPLGQMATILSLAIDVDAPGGRAEGFVISEERLFSLDLANGRARCGDIDITLREGDVIARPDELYVSVERLEVLLPLGFRHSAREAMVVVVARELLPLQIRRRSERLAARNSAGFDAMPTGPVTHLPWTAFDGPFVDHVLRLQSLPASGFTVNHSTHVTAEILGLQAEAFVGGSGSDLVSDSRVTLGRRDPDGGIFGRLGLREALIGDVFDGGLNLVLAPESGRGIRLGTFPLQQSDRFGVESLRGPLPSGWMVELHRDGALIDLQTPGSDELYEFLDVPLHQGTNELRLIFRGPRGERREEVVRRQVGVRTSAPGEMHWRMGALRDDDGAWQAQFGFERAIGQAMVFTTALASAELSSGSEQYLSAGLQASAGRFLTTLDLAVSASGGHAAEASVATRLGPVNLSMRHAELSRFDSSFFGVGKSLVRRRSQAALFAAFRAGDLRFPISVALAREELADGNSSVTALLRTGLSTGQLHVSHELAWRESDSSFGEDRIEGRLIARARMAELLLRSDLIYSLHSGFEPESMSLGAERMLGPAWFLRGEVGHDWLGDTMRVAAGAEWTGRLFGIGGDIGWDDGGLRVALTIRTGIARRPGGGWHARAEPLAGLGAAEVVAFLDENADGVMNPGELPIRGTVRADRTGVSAITDEEGTAFLSRLPVHRAVSVSLQASEFEDPLAMAAPEFVTIVPRPGRVAQILLPVVISGDIAGTILVREVTGERPAGGARIELVGRGGRIVATTVAAHDGYFNLTRVPPGTHEFRAELPLRRDAFVLGKVAPVIVGGDGLILDGVNLVLAPATGSDVMHALLLAEPAASRLKFPAMAPVGLLEQIVALGEASQNLEEPPQVAVIPPDKVIRAEVKIPAWN